MSIEYKQAYTLAKIICRKLKCDVPSYVLKTITLQAYSDCTENPARAELYGPSPCADVKLILLWTRIIAERLQRACKQKSLPSFFLPAYNLYGPFFRHPAFHNFAVLLGLFVSDPEEDILWQGRLYTWQERTWDELASELIFDKQ